MTSRPPPRPPSSGGEPIEAEALLLEAPTIMERVVDPLEPSPTVLRPPPTGRRPTERRPLRRRLRSLFEGFLWFARGCMFALIIVLGLRFGFGITLADFEGRLQAASLPTVRLTTDGATAASPSSSAPTPAAPESDTVPRGPPTAPVAPDPDALEARASKVYESLGQRLDEPCFGDQVLQSYLQLGNAIAHLEAALAEARRAVVHGNRMCTPPPQ